MFPLQRSMLYTAAIRELDESVLICPPCTSNQIGGISLHASGGGHGNKEGLHVSLGSNHKAGVLPSCSRHTTTDSTLQRVPCYFACCSWAAHQLGVCCPVIYVVESVCVYTSTVESVCERLHAQTKSITCSVDAYSACSGC